MTVVFGKENGGYARGVGSGVTYNRYFDLPRRRKENDERLELLQIQLDNERRERQKKDLVVKQLSNEMSQKMHWSRNCPVRWQKQRECLLT